MKAPTTWRSIKGGLDVLAGDAAVTPSTLMATPLGPPAVAGLPPTTGRSPSPSATEAGDLGAAIVALEVPAHASARARFALALGVERSESAYQRERVGVKTPHANQGEKS